MHPFPPTGRALTGVLTMAKGSTAVDGLRRMMEERKTNGLQYVWGNARTSVTGDIHGMRLVEDIILENVGRSVGPQGGNNDVPEGKGNGKKTIGLCHDEDTASVG